jgi:hypothetical protein
MCSPTAFTTRYRGGAPPRRRGAMRKTSSTAQPSPGKGVGGGRTATSMLTTALALTEWAARPIRAECAVPAEWRWRLCARPCCSV